MKSVLFDIAGDNKSAAASNGGEIAAAPDAPLSESESGGGSDAMASCPGLPGLPAVTGCEGSGGRVTMSAGATATVGVGEGGLARSEDAFRWAGMTLGAGIASPDEARRSNSSSPARRNCALSSGVMQE